MSTTTDLVDRFKQEKKLSSDNAAARALGLSRQAISSYRAGLRHAEPEVVRKLAEALGEDPELFVLHVQAERETIPARRKVWLRCAERLARVAAVVLAIIWAQAGFDITQAVVCICTVVALLLSCAGSAPSTGEPQCNLIARPA